VIALILLVLIAVSSVIIRGEYVRDGGRLLLAYDPYYHYRMAETIVEEGHRPEWDYMASWPTGQPGDKHPPLYHYFLAYTFTIFGGLVNHDLLTWCCYACSIPVVLFVILAFITGRELTHTAGGLAAAFLFAMAPATMERTFIGFADTDGFILIFSLLISFFWIKSLSGSQKYLYAALAGFSVFLFELTWIGYWYMLFLVAGASAAFVVIHYFMKKEVDITHISIVLLAFLIPHEFYSHFILEGLILIAMAAGLIITFRFEKKWIVALIISGCCAYILLSEGFLHFLFQRASDQSFVEAKGFFYPYVGPFISQRQDVTLSRLAADFTITLLLAPAGLYLLLRKKDEKSYALFAFFALFTLGSIIMLFSGTRYLLQASLPVLLSSSIALSYIFDKVATDPRRSVLAFFGVALLLVPVYVSAETTNTPKNPIEGAWVEALVWIQENTPEDSVVISDWENGYWVESIARRKSIMNGGHYNLYWRVLKFGKIMETTDEEVAVKEIYGFENSSETRAIRNFPEGEAGNTLVKKEMTPFAVEGQEAYVIIGERTALTFHIISTFGTWDYTTGEGQPTQLYGGTPVGTILQPYWKQYLFNTEEFPVAVYEADSEYHSYIVKGNSILPTQGTVYTQDGETHFLTREKGTYGVVWFFSDTSMIVVPTTAVDMMIVRLFVFNGDGLTSFELVADFGTVKVFKVHREPQDNLNKAVLAKEDQWRPW
jgi:asparagine N-glycosylation enzyme membrane subunit Stt3